MPILLPAEPWKTTGRWDLYGETLFRLKDRHEREMLLGPTQEEVVAELVARDLPSYRDLPVNLYQVEWKYRDEFRPRFGLLRDARVPDEGRLHVRPGRGGDGGLLRRHAAGLPEGVRPVRAVVHRRRGRAGTDRRRREPRVHGARGRGRGPVRRVRQRRLPGRLEGRDPAPARTRVGGRRRATREGPHAGRSDDRGGLEAARRAGRTDAEDDAVRRRRPDRRGPAAGRPGGRGGQGRAAVVPGAGPPVRGRRLRGPGVREGLRRPAGPGAGRDDPRGSLGARRGRLGDRCQRARAPRHRRERPAATSASIGTRT